MTKENKVLGGLKELPPDSHDFKLGAIIPIKEFPKLEKLPDEFVLETSDLKDQLDDQCTGNTTALLIGTNEGIPIEETWMFAKSKELSGDVDSWGQNLRTAFKVGTKFGALPKNKSPFTSEKGNEFLRRIENWPDGLDFYASPQKQKTFWAVSGPYDAFDNIRATIFYLKNKLNQKQGVGMGLVWGYPAEQYILSEIKESGEGHAITCKGWKKPIDETYLVLQNSWGKEAGKNGEHLILREVVNHFASKYGVFVYLDMPREKAEYYLENNIKLGDNWAVEISKSLWRFFRDMFWEDRLFGAERSGEWPRLRDKYFSQNLLCELCGERGREVHHIIPVSVDKSKELLWENLVTGCKKCHLRFYHLGSFRSYEKDIKKEIALWKTKRANRP